MAGCGGACFVWKGLPVESGVGVVYVLLVQLFPHLLDGAAETLEVDDLPFSKEADDVGDIGVILGQAEDVVVSYPGLLFRYDLVRTTMLKSLENAMFLVGTSLPRLRSRMNNFC